MSLGPPDSEEPPKRRPTYRKIIQQDVTRGIERVRRWPRRRPSKPSKKVAANLEKFRQTQKAWNYYSPDAQSYVLKQVEGTPLLPRDMFTMMMFNRLFAVTLDNGKELWPMPARTDVSQALDVLGKIPGMTLRRGENFWEALEGGGGGGGGRGTRLDYPNLLFENGDASNWTLTDYTVLTNQSGLTPWIGSHFAAANLGGIPRRAERTIDLSAQFTDVELDSVPVCTLLTITGSYGNDDDHTRCTVQPLDGSNADLGQPFDWRDFPNPAVSLNWTSTFQVFPLPEGTRKLEFTASAVRTTGSSANVALQGIIGWLDISTA